MSDHWIRFISNETGGSMMAIVAGTVIRGLVSPGGWVWRQWLVSLAVAIPSGLYVVPWMVETLQWSQAGNNMLCLAVGMISLPAAQGVLSAAAFWRDNSSEILRKWLRR